MEKAAAGVSDAEEAGGTSGGDIDRREHSRRRSLLARRIALRG